MPDIDGPYKPGDFERLANSQIEAEILALKGNIDFNLTHYGTIEAPEPRHVDPRERHAAVRVLE
jgi:hypothetical protein